MGMKEYKGLAGANGQGIGKAVKLEKQECIIKSRQILDVEEETSRFKEVQAAYSEELTGLYDMTLEKMGKDAAEIFHAYKMIANDDYFFQNAIKKVKEESVNIDYAIEEEKRKTCELFASMPDEYMRERAVTV